MKSNFVSIQFFKYLMHSLLKKMKKVGTLQAEATNGSNIGYRFIGSGALAYTTFPTTSPCSYGGLTYAYTNSTIRIWKPGVANLGNIICIPKTFGGGMHTQGSNLAVAKAHIWIPRGNKI